MRISVSPNPSEGIFEIMATEKNCSIEVSEFTGKLFYSSLCEAERNTINLAGLAKEVYLLSVKRNNYRILQKNKC